MKTRVQTEIHLNHLTQNLWGLFCEIRPKMVRFNPPKIELCGRIYRTAGYCEWENNLVRLSWKAFEQGFTTNMQDVILPHELAHQVDFNLRGRTPDKKEWHSGQWAKIMLDYGLPADRYHSLDISR